jgi:F-type H+-transporting ATPase subunit delta
MKNVRVARRYAQALMAVAEERKDTERIAADLAEIGASLQSSRELRVLLSSPVVREGKKRAIFQDLWGGEVSRTTLAFLLLLIQHQRERILPEVIGEFHTLRDEREGIVAADVRTAVPISSAQEKELGTRLMRSTGKRVRLRAAVDPAIKGGLVVRIGDTVVDASVRHQLERLRERLLEGGSPTNTHA